MPETEICLCTDLIETELCCFGVGGFLLITSVRFCGKSNAILSPFLPFFFFFEKFGIELGRCDAGLATTSATAITSGVDEGGSIS